MFWLELLVVLAALALGARLGGIFLGIAGGLGLAFLVFVFGLAPSAPPIDVMLIITAVIVAASVLQVAGGMDYLVSVAEKILRSNPKYITFLAPMVCYLFTFMAGTGNIAFALLPVIAEVARETGVRPERPMSISVVASQQAITASPVSAAMAALVALLSPLGVGMGQIMLVCVPATLIGCFLGALSVCKRGVELDKDPVYQRRLAAGVIKASESREKVAFVPKKGAKLSVAIFVLGAVLIVLFGTIPSLRPTFMVEGKLVTLKTRKTSLGRSSKARNLEKPLETGAFRLHQVSVYCIICTLTLEQNSWQPPRNTLSKSARFPSSIKRRE